MVVKSIGTCAYIIVTARSALGMESLGHTRSGFLQDNQVS